MGKDRFKTKKVGKIRSVNTVVFLLIGAGILAFFLFYLHRFFNVFEGTYLNEIDGAPLILVLVTVAAVEVFLWFFLPIAGVFFGIQKGRLKGHRERATFTATQGIIYYREFLKDVSPADLSIVMDLGVESEKDISATMLRLYNKKVIDFENEKIIFTGNYAPLDGSESEILEMLRHGGLSRNGIYAWKNNRLRDAEMKGYVEKTSDNIALKGCGCGCLGVVLVIVAMVILIAVTVGFDGYNLDIFDSAVDRLADGIDTGAAVSQSDIQTVTNFMYTAVILFGLIDLVMLIPAFTLFKTLAHSAVKLKIGLRRTQKGNELAEKAAGLKRFINEFSILSERDKEEVRLWDDFLVYAVVLEENDRIVEDIFKTISNPNVLRVCRSAGVLNSSFV